MDRDLNADELSQRRENDKLRQDKEAAYTATEFDKNAGEAATSKAKPALPRPEPKGSQMEKSVRTVESIKRKPRRGYVHP